MDTHLLDGVVSLLLGTETPPTDVRALRGGFFATMTTLGLLAAQLLLEEPGVSEDPCGFRPPPTGLA